MYFLQYVYKRHIRYTILWRNIGYGIMIFALVSSNSYLATKKALSNDYDSNQNSSDGFNDFGALIGSAIFNFAIFSSNSYSAIRNTNEKQF